MFKHFLAIVALSLLIVIGCLRTESVTVRGPNGEERTVTTDSLFGSDRTVVIANEKAYRDCLSMNAQTMGGSQADYYCRSVIAPQSGMYTMAPGTPLGLVQYPQAAPLGPHMNRGSIADPVQAGYAVANTRADATYPEAAKNPQDFARRTELRTVARDVNKLGDDVAATNADLQDHKKNGRTVPKAPPKK